MPLIVMKIFILCNPLELGARYVVARGGLQRPSGAASQSNRPSCGRPGRINTMQSTMSVYWLVLTALAIFQLKHFACDFALQTPRQIQAKGNYGQIPGLEHAGLHAIASLPALLVLTRSPLAIAIVVLSEFVVHYHVDWAKAQIDKRQNFRNTSTAYWVVFGLDQFIHQMTYLAIVFVFIPSV